MAEIQALNHRHEGVINWLLANPHRKLGECARELGYTQPWLSNIIASDMFQAEYRRRCKETGVEAVHLLSHKIARAAHLGLDTIIAKLESGVASDAMVLSASKLALTSMGYGAPKTTTETTVNVVVDSETLAAARERFLRPRATIEVVTEEAVA